MQPDSGDAAVPRSQTDEHSPGPDPGSGHRPALFQRYPFLVDRLPFAPILAGPTPCRRMAGLERVLGAGPLWAKRDDLTAVPYGGNKPRKLELILGEAQARGARALITFGGLGSHHVLATTVYARRLGLAVVAILVPQPVDEHVRQNLLATHTQGARLVFAGNTPGAVAAASRSWLAALLSEGRPAYVIPPGGSSPVGSLGYVGAALELADQVERGEASSPDAIFVAAGSNGTAAGLLVGLRLAGLAARLVAVKVNDRLPVTPRSIADLASATADLLRRHGVERGALGSFGPSDLEVWEQYLGAGYGHPTLEAERAIREVGEAEGLALDRTYTGKTVAAFLDAARRPEWRGKRLLYWHTLNGHPLASLLPAEPRIEALPAPFDRLLS